MTVNGQAVAWSLAELGDEQRTLTITIKATACGEDILLGGFAYTDAQGVTATLPMRIVDVVGCAA